MSETESYSFLFCHHSLNTSVAACGGTYVVKYLTAVSSIISFFALVVVIIVVPKRKSIFNTSNNKIKDTSAKVTWLNVVCFVIKSVLFALVALDIGVPKSKNDYFISSFYADVIFLSTSLSSAISMRTFIYCRKILMKQQKSINELNENEVSTELTPPVRAAPIPENKIPWKSFVIDNFPAIWISTLLFVGWPLAILGIFMKNQRQFLLIRQIRSIFVGVLYILAGIIVYNLNREFKNMSHDEDVKISKKGKSKTLMVTSETKLADPVKKNSSIVNSKALQKKAIFQARSKTVYK